MSPALHLVPNFGKGFLLTKASSDLVRREANQFTEAPRLEVPFLRTCHLERSGGDEGPRMKYGVHSSWVSGRSQASTRMDLDACDAYRDPMHSSYPRTSSEVGRREQHINSRS